MKTKNDRYTKILEWSDEDDCYVGRCPELFIGGIHGDDRAKVFAELCDAVDEWIELIEADGGKVPEPLAGKDFSGKFILRVDPELHRLLAIRALQTGDSLNSYVAKRLREAA